MNSLKSKNSNKQRVKSSSANKIGKNYNFNRKESLKAIEEIKKFYSKYYSSVNSQLINLIKNEDLIINLNLFNSKDIIILSFILMKYYYFKSIHISKNEQKKPNTNVKKNQKNDKYPNPNPKEQKLREYERKEALKQLLKGIGKNLYSCKKLTNLTLFDFTIDKKMAENINEGISHNSSLQVLTLKNCNMTVENYEILLEGLLNHERIKTIDLSDNNLNDKCGNMISRIIMRQSQRRDQIIWSYGLRNELPTNNDYQRGLISISLHGNQLGDKATDKICFALCSDQYIRAIDLSNNCIDNNSCKKYIYMMRKNNTLLTLDLRNNIGYDENIHSRLVMKMSKNIHILYQQYQNGIFTEEEFENLKDFIEISFFDVDIPQEIVEFYNKNLPEDDGDEEESLNIKDHIMGNDLQNNELQNNEEENGINKLQNKSNNFSSNNLNKSVNSNHEKSLMEENLRLKQQIIELKALNLQKQLKSKQQESIDEKANIKPKEEMPRSIKDDYKRIIELVNELNQVMNELEEKKSKKHKHSDKKKSEKDSGKISNKNEIVIEAQEPPKEENESIEKKIEQQIIIENKKKQIEEKPQHKIREEENMIMENEPKRFENLKKSEEKKELEDEKQNSEMKESDELYKINEIENRKEIEEEMEEKVKEEKTDKSQKEKNKIQEFNKPIPYQELQAEPSEDNNSQFMDEDGNIYNFDDLTEEEKMSILQQQILLQRLQEEAEARGEHFDPREYLAYLEQQAEEEEMLQKQESNKLNKSF